MSKDVLLSVIAPVYNEQDNLELFVKRVLEVVGELKVLHEIILVDDGSNDNSYSVALKLAEKNPAVKVISFSRNFGHQVAVTAGIDFAKGDAIVIIDSDLQDPPEVIKEMFKKWQEGYEVVYGKRRNREGETKFKILTAKFFYRIFKYLTDKTIPEDTGDFRLLDKKVADVFKKMPERHRFIRGMVSWCGFKQGPVLYDRNPRYMGKTKYPLTKMILFALDAITSFSVIPLRLITFLGIFIIFAVICLSILIVIVKLMNYDYFILGFPVLTLSILLFGGLQLFAIGILGEYLGRIYQESKGRPLYVVKEVYSREQ